MQKFILTIALILLCFGSVYSQETVKTGIDQPKSSKYIYQIDMGSAYSFYFFDIQNLLDSMDKSSLSRMPFSINFLFGKKMSDTLAWTISLTAGMDIFSAAPDSLQLYTADLTGGFQFIPFTTGLTMGINAGFSVFIPNTNLIYKGSTEIGSLVSLDLGYTFETLKFSKLGIIPGIEFKFIHSEMFRGSVNQICGYINLGIR